MEKDEILNFVYFDRYKPEKKIGQGSFGRIYQGLNIEENEKVAMKFEEKEKNLLETETYRLIYLKSEGVPKVFCFGNDNKYNILVMEILGRSLDSYFNECGKKMRLLTVCYLGIEMVKRIRYIHEKNHIHRDIKPDNFVMGIDKDIDKLFIIDFGLAKKYRSSKTHQHIPFKVHKRITGTIRYSSTNASQCYEQSRRDDLESIGYLICYFLKGSLPWQGLKIGQNEDRIKAIFKKKRDTKIETLTAGLHNNIHKYIEYCRKLGFEDEPNYDYLINLLYEAMEMKIFKIDFDYDWNRDISVSPNISKTLDTSNLDNSMNASNMNNKNSNSGLGSVINKNEISQDLKNIIVDDNNSIKEYKEKEKREVEKEENKNKRENKKTVEIKPQDDNQSKNKTNDALNNNKVDIKKKESDVSEKNTISLPKKEKKDEENSVCRFI